MDPQAFKVLEEVYTVIASGNITESDRRYIEGELKPLLTIYDEAESAEPVEGKIKRFFQG